MSAQCGDKGNSGHRKAVHVAHIIGMSGSVKGQTFEINKDRTTLGRNSNNDIVLTDEAVSSQHCAIIRRGDRYLLRDLNSTNGTLLNYDRVTDEVELQPKHVIQIGSCEFLFDGAAEKRPGSSASAMTHVVVDAEKPVIKPTLFDSISPFGTRRRRSRKLWAFLFGLIGLVVLALLVVFIKMISG